MKHFDVFNGDADGLCALHQLRLATPVESELVSGPKRDIALLARVPAQAGDAVTVLDISLAVNREALVSMLARGVSVRWFDHHHAGDIPAHPRLVACIDPSPDVCTAMLVDRWLDGAHRIWAVAAAFGDNLHSAAIALAAPLALTRMQLERLRELGETLNYNGYGDADEDLIVHPVALFRCLARYADPFSFMRNERVYGEIASRRREDMDRAATLDPTIAFAGATLHVLPDEPWSRRVRGAFANDLANRLPHLAHAVLARDAARGYTVSLRAPAGNAARFCLGFPTGGGRATAAGINHLPAEQLAEFARRLDEAFPGEAQKAACVGGA